MSWIGFNTAVSGFHASQRSLYTANHNITNANTEGYSRQETVQQSRTPMMLTGTGMLGTGTEITEINRVRDSYIDFKFRAENTAQGEWEVKRDSMVEMERLFNEPSESSFRKYTDDFFTSLETLSKNPSDYASRSLVREKSIALTGHFNETAGRLYKQREETNFAIETKVTQINDLAKGIRNLNEQIYELELGDIQANDLRDNRGLLVDKLSKMINVNVNESNDGKFDVSIGGITLVNHVEVRGIKYNGKENGQDDIKVSLEWENGGKINMKSGELKGYFDLINGDGENGTYRGTSFYIDRLDQFANKFIERMNDVHKDGKGLNGSEDILMFTVDDKKTVDFDPTTDKITAANLTLSGDIQDDLNNIAAASEENEVENNEKILELIELRENKMFFDDPTNPPQGTPDDYIKSLLSTLAVDSQQADRMNNNQSTILDNIEIRRESESGVSIDEEMANIVKYQHAYNAAAKMITTMDSIYDVMINRLGLVGR